MDEKLYNKQIEQMCSFIGQEADEKVNEIRIKTDHDFSLTKQMLVHNSKLKLMQDFKQKEKEAETQKRIRKSIALGESRVKKMVAREELIQQVKGDAVVRLSKLAAEDQNTYTELLKKLIVQGLIKLNEVNVSIMCREVDIKIVKKVMEEAGTIYKKMIKDTTKEDIKLNLTLNETKFLAPATSSDGKPTCAGGVKLVAMGGRIILDNTLDSRLSIAFYDLMPMIRSTIFKNNV